MEVCLYDLAIGTLLPDRVIGKLQRNRSRIQSRMVETGSSYLSQSELAVTFGLAKRDKADRVVIEWPSGQVQEFRNVNAGEYQCTEGKNPVSVSP